MAARAGANLISIARRFGICSAGIGESIYFMRKTRRRDMMRKYGKGKNNLRLVWSDKSREADFRYPAKVHPMFVALMERFDLSYRVAGSPLGGQADETSLIAQLVPDVRPQDDIDREWPEAAREGDEEQVQICKIVDAK